MPTAKHEAITSIEYRAFQQAYDFFNRQLFGGALPHVLVTLQRKGRTRGYFSPERFTGRGRPRATAHELAMNPNSFTGRSDEDILSTLAHEMTHVWQQALGNPPRRAYHDREWAAKMKEIGLQPSDTGQVGGKETGQHMTHYIVAGGAFANAYTALKARGFRLNWQSAPASAQAKAKRASKTKFTCPDCGQNAWAKAHALLGCGTCYDDGEGELVLMFASSGED